MTDAVVALTYFKIYPAINLWSKVKVKQSRYTPWRRLGGEEV
jgi:hypothetical protein